MTFLKACTYFLIKEDKTCHDNKSGSKHDQLEKEENKEQKDDGPAVVGNEGDIETFAEEEGKDSSDDEDNEVIIEDTARE